MAIPKRITGYAKQGLAGAVILGALAVSYFRIFDTYEFEFLDLRFRARPPQQTFREMAIIEIGDDTLQQLGKWPLDREFYAMLIQALTDSGARSILFDVFFPEEREHDKEFEDEVRKAGNIYLSFVLDLTDKFLGGIRQAKGCRADIVGGLKDACRRSGNISVMPDIDGKFRRIPLFVEYDGTRYPYLSFLMACDYLGVAQEKVRIIPRKRVIVGDLFSIPLDDQSNMIVNFSGPWGFAFKHYSYVDIIQSFFAKSTGDKPRLDLGVFKDKICIVGLTAAGTTDVHPTPLQPIYPGVGIQAEVFNSVLTRHFITRLSREANLIILVLLGLAVSVSTTMTRPLKGLLVLILVSFLLVAASFVVFTLFGIWMDVFYPLVFLIALYLVFIFRKYLVEWHKRLFMEHELEVARTIQESFLPKSFPRTEQLEISSMMFAARHVGGDLYDLVDLGEGKIGIMIGDVSGKGIPAALFMAKVISEFRFLVANEPRPSALLTRLNQKLVAEASSSLFVTVCYLVVDTVKGDIRFASGGHLGPVLSKGRDGTTRILAIESGMPLGLAEGEYAESSIVFEKDDTLVLYTDGVTEAMNTQRAMYGEDRLQEIVKNNRYRSTEALLSIIREDVQRFEGKAGQHDDTTLVILRAK